MSVATYELTSGLVIASILLYLSRARRAAVLRATADLVAVGVLLATRTSQTGKHIHSLHMQLHHVRIIWWQSLDVLQRVALPFGPVLSRGTTWKLALVVLLLAVLAFRFTKNDVLRREIRRWLLTATLGIVGVAAGYFAIVPADEYYSPGQIGEGNRINAAAALGYVTVVYAYAMLVGLLLLGIQRRSRPLATGFALALIGVVCAGFVRHTVRDRSLWDMAAQAERSTLAVIDRTLPDPPPAKRIYVWGHHAEITDGVPAFHSTWDLPNAVMHLRNDLSLRTYPILSTTGFECGKTRMYPTNGLYGPSFATPYGGAVFLDYTRARVETIGSQSSCQEAVDRLSTPKLSFRTLPDAIKNGQTLHLYAILHQGADPLRYLPVTFTIGRGAQRETCASTTLPPSGEASCEIRPVAQPVGRQPVTISFAGTETLRAASSTAPVLIEPISGACASAASAQPGIIAVFGHAPTATEARKLQARAESVGFQEVVVEQVDCADFRVVLHGIPNRKVGADFQREARNAGFDVVIESG